MKIIGINGSPRADGNTALALREMAGEMAAAGAEMEIIHVGGRLIRGCQACGACGRNKDRRCIVTGDGVNEAIEKMAKADGIVLGSPVHFAGIGGTMKSFCDRAFYVAGANGGLFTGKVGAAVVAVRRSGGTAAWAGLNYYLTIANMAIAGSTYWSVVHGGAAGEAEGDEEGLQAVRNAAKSIVALLGGPAPEYDRGARTSFIR